MSQVTTAISSVALWDLSSREEASAVCEVALQAGLDLGLWSALQEQKASLEDATYLQTALSKFSSDERQRDHVMAEQLRDKAARKSIKMSIIHYQYGLSRFCKILC